MKLIIRLVFALLGGLAAAQVAEQAGMTHQFSEAGAWARWVGVIVGGAAAGWLVAFFLRGIAIVGIRRIEAAAQRRSAGELVVGGVGLLLGLGVGALAALAIGALPYVGNYLLLPLFLVLGYVFARVAARSHRADPAARRARRREQRGARDRRQRATPKRRRPTAGPPACSSTPPPSSTAASATSWRPASSIASS